MDDLFAETRGKCSVTLLSEVETPASYTGRSDAFFYSLVFDPHQKSLVADRGEIRIGSSYQATVTPLQNKRQRELDRKDAGALDEMIWDPTNPLDKEDVEKYLTVAKSGSIISYVSCSTISLPFLPAAQASRSISRGCSPPPSEKFKIVQHFAQRGQKQKVLMPSQNYS